MEFLLEFLLDVFLALFSMEVIRFIGVCALYVLGFMTGACHSFKDLWITKPAKNDYYTIFTEETVQKIAGFIVIISVTFIWFAM